MLGDTDGIMLHTGALPSRKLVNKTKTEAEFYLPEFKELIDDPETQRDWDRIATFDPLGMYLHPFDGMIVDANKEILTSKCAVYYSWNLLLFVA